MIEKGVCQGCGKIVKFWHWRRCYDCALEYENEMELISSTWPIDTPEPSEPDYNSSW